MCCVSAIRAVHVCGSRCHCVSLYFWPIMPISWFYIFCCCCCVRCFAIVSVCLFIFFREIIGAEILCVSFRYASIFQNATAKFSTFSIYDCCLFLLVCYDFFHNYYSFINNMEWTWTSYIFLYYFFSMENRRKKKHCMMRKFVRTKTSSVWHRLGILNWSSLRCSGAHNDHI